MIELDEDVLVAAVSAVEGLSPQVRRNLAAGAGFVRLGRYDALRLIGAVDRLTAAIDEANLDNDGIDPR